MGPCSSRPSKVVADVYKGKQSSSQNSPGSGTMAFLERYDCTLAANEILGSGAYSTVYKCVDRNSGEECAVKVVELKEMAEDELEALHIEVGILEDIKHPNVSTHI